MYSNSAFNLRDQENIDCLELGRRVEASDYDYEFADQEEAIVALDRLQIEMRDIDREESELAAEVSQMVI
jgi:hypothetical protein